MKLKELFEMAQPREVDLAKIYYHGTDNLSNLQSLKDKGLIAPEILKPKASLAPQQGKVYVTPHLDYALIYAIGSACIPNKVPERWLEKEDTRYGLLCVIEGKDFLDIVPDEDSIGELVCKKKFYWLNSLAQDLVAVSTYRKVMDGDYASWAKIGKIILKRLNEKQIFELIDYGSHIAHGGSLKIKEIWKIDKSLCPELKKDGSNFFKLAEKLK